MTYPADYLPPIKEGVKDGDDKWTIDELTRIGSRRLDTLIQRIIELEHLQEEKKEAADQLNQKRDREIDILSPEDYENLGTLCDETSEQEKNFEEQKRQKLEELKAVIDLNYPKLERYRKNIKEEKERKELDESLEKFRSILFVPGNFTPALDALIKGRKEFKEKLEKSYGVSCGRYQDEKARADCQRYVDASNTACEEQVSRLQASFEELKTSGRWKKEFLAICGVDPCKHLDLSLDVKIYGKGWYREPDSLDAAVPDYSVKLSFSCSLSGRFCVADKYLQEKRASESMYAGCVGYNIPDNLATRIKKVWDRRKSEKWD